MELALPEIDQKTIDNKSSIVKNLSKLTNPENVLSHADEIKPYETDALAAYTQTPLAVVLPENTNEVSEILEDKLAFYLIKAEDKKLGTVKPLTDETVKEAILRLSWRDLSH